MGFGVWVRVVCLAMRVSVGDSRFRGSRDRGIAFGGSGFHVRVFEVRGLVFRVRCSGFRGSRCRVRGFEVFEVGGLGFRV